MTRPHALAAAAALALATAVSSAQPQDHKAHHPEGASAPATAADAKDVMAAHMKAMRRMHEKMAAAKTAAEREALMPEHMKLMREGMSMMGSMSNGKVAADPAIRQQMNENRMDMMQSMMQMMMDCMPMPPAAPGK